MKRKLTLETTSTSLHLMAMAIMLIDHCKRLFITQRESVLVQVNGRSGECVGYAPLNPYYQQAADMVAAKN